MSTKDTAFYQKKKVVSFDFSAERISSDGGLLLLEKVCRKTKVLASFSDAFPDHRHSSYIEHSAFDLIRQRVFLLACGYEDANDLSYLKDDPLLSALFEQGLSSQPTMSRFENSVSMTDLYRLCLWWIDRYVASLSCERKYVIIDVDCTDDPTHGAQQGSLFHGYYWQWMYNELFYLDAETGQIILPVLRPGNVHSSKWNDRFLRIICRKIRERFPDMQIIIRADAGFSSAAFYQVVQDWDLDFCLGISANERIRKLVDTDYEEVFHTYAKHGIRYQRFVGPFSYQADSWEQPQDLYAKIESTGKGMNLRFYISNFADEHPEKLYKEFYVQRAEAAENRIKEIKNMCFSDRLSCHRYSANFFRLMLSALAYELLRQVRTLIQKTGHPKAGKWNLHSIRLYLIKVAATVRIRVRRIHVAFSRAHPKQQLLRKVILLC